MAALAPITSRVAARAPGLARVARRSAWRARNLPRSLGYKPAAGAYDAQLLAELQERGIAIRPFEAVFRDSYALERLADLANARRDEGSASPTKEFLIRLMPRELSLDSPYVAPALEPQIVALANAYIGMRSYLRALDVWLNIPTDEPAKLSQLWHRDYDDEINLKVFVYLTDVTEHSGPFTFAPGTQPGGPRPLALKDRVDDDAMARHVPRDEWVVATGTRGTVVLADTCGYHKGGKPTAGERILWTAQFTSGAAGAQRNFELTTNGVSSLSRDQQWAVLERPPLRP